MRAIALLAPVLVAACSDGNGSSVEPNLRFADRTDAEIARMISAAGGTDMFSAQSQLDQLGDTFDPDPCPTVSIDGRVATITGGCTTADGVEIQGSATVTNPASWDQIEWDPAIDARYAMDGLAFVQTGYTQSFDGTFAIGNTFQAWDADLTAESLDVAVYSDLHFRCSTSSCSLSDSGLELIGAGGAHVSGSVAISGSTSASFTLRGVDTVVATVANGCVEWHLEGTDRGMDCP
jgi:hypothetical protein